jgi:hypothetical protein
MIIRDNSMRSPRQAGNASSREPALSGRWSQTALRFENGVLLRKTPEAIASQRQLLNRVAV